MAGQVHPQTGPIKYRRGGLALVGIPLVMGSAALTARQVLPKLNTIRAGHRSPSGVRSEHPCPSPRFLRFVTRVSGHTPIIPCLAQTLYFFYFGSWLLLITPNLYLIECTPPIGISCGDLLAICRLQPAYILCVRVVLSFAISRLDYVSEAVPLAGQCLTPIQLAVDAALTAALRMPRSTPKALLYAPLRAGGFGFPNLNTRSQLRFISGIYRALNSRNALVRRSTRWLFLHPPNVALPHNDIATLHSLLALHCLQCSLSPSTFAQPAAEVTTSLRPYVDQDVILISDGSAPKHRLGWGAVVAVKPQQ